MFASCLFYLLWCALLSAALCGFGAIASYFIQGQATAIALIKAWVIDFNGILVGSVGYGLMLFTRNRGRTILAQVNSFLDVPPAHAPALIKLQGRSVSWLWANLISVPLTVIGGFVLWNCGFPLQGFARLYLAICSISIYYVASTILAFFIYSLALFNYIDEQSQNRNLECLKANNASPVELEHIDTFFVLCSTVGIFAIYLGFRGTLTATFASALGVFHDLLFLPLFLYLPTTLCYSFYPRYVLRKIFERDIIGKIREFEKQIDTSLSAASFKDNLEIKKLVFEIREKMMQEHRASPILGFKDAPSLTISLLILLQILLQKDSVIAGFLGKLFK